MDTRAFTSPVNGIMNMKLLTKKNWPLVAIAISITGLLFRYGPWLSQKGTSTKDNGNNLALTSTDLSFLQQKVETINSLLSREKEYKRRVEESQQTIASWEKSFFSGTPETATAVLVAIVEEIAAKSGVVVKNKTLHPSLPGSTVAEWKRIGVTIEGRTSFRELTDFYSTLIAAPKSLFVERIELRLDEYNGLLNFKLRLYSFTQ
jgi:hypothetical protein